MVGGRSGTHKWCLNPCPCGYFTDPQRPCTCSPPQIQRYRSRISGPLLDRIDLHLDVPPLRYREITTDSQGEPSEQVRERVKEARALQQERFRRTRTFCNAQMGVKQLRRHCQIGPDGQALLETAIERLGLSARAHDRILKVARTIADLEGHETIRTDHLAEAIQYRTLDRRTGW
ncbi:ATP-binding protein [Candidatus Methylomirabilis sp.]|uniref:magnesium chelatase subunit ChlI family protein n=1 Tax=Candidatus Methylomirabilis sp. TaxID=2032687 RepID=UPI003075F951